MNTGLSVVTGANGYLGYSLVKELTSRGENVRLLMRKERPELAVFGGEIMLGDINDYDYLLRAFEGAQTVYHVAGMIDITGTKDDLVWKVNYDGTVNVVEACKKCGVKNLVFVSSVDCIPVNDDMHPIRETSRFDTACLSDAYGKSKAAASQYVINSNTASLKTVVVQPSCVIGPDDIYHNNSVCTLVSLYEKGIFMVSLDFGAYNFVDVRDVAAGMISAAEKGRGGESYFLSGETLTVDEFIATLAEINGKNPPKVKMSKTTLLHLCPEISLFFKTMHWPPVLTPFSINKICENCDFSYEKAANELGYSPRSAKESLRDTVNWLKENPAGQE